MPSTPRRLTPGARLAASLVVALASVALCTALARATPWLGLALAADSTGARVAAVAPGGPADGVARAGERLAAVGEGRESVAPAAGDLLEEPDVLDTWPQTDAFYARQGRLARLLAAPRVTVVVRDDAGAARAVTIAPARRPLAALPAMFWTQLFFGVAMLLVGAWVWSLRPEHWGARMYAVTGATALVFTHAAAVYSTRELALPAGLFRALAGVNHAGAALFGAGLCGLFLVYPRLLVPPRAIAGVFALVALWVGVDVLHLAPDQNWASRYLIMGEMLAAVVLAAVQWRRSRGDAVGRSGLRWFATCVLVGSGLFVGLTYGSLATGLLPPIPQGWAFGFFLLMFVGMAVGLRRHRLFDLDEWALRVLLWGLAFGAALGAEVFLLGVVGLGPRGSLSVLLVLALAWLPFRDWLWTRLTRRRTPPPEALFEGVLAAGFAGSDVERAEAWRGLLRRAFDPLRVEEADAATAPREAPEVRDDGLALALPALAGAPPLLLTHPWGGRGTFGARHQRLADTIVQLMRSADEGRQAFLRGVQRERTRIARDLHDDVSSPLLAGLARADARGGDARAADDIRDALAQMRAVVTGEPGEGGLLPDCVADVRYETAARLAEHGVQLEWALDPLPELPLAPAQRKAIVSFHREAVTNVLKHARASRVVVRLAVTDGVLTSRVHDDGVGPAGASPATAGTRQGLANLAARAAELGGRASVGPDPAGGTVAELVAPLSSAASPVPA